MEVTVRTRRTRFDAFEVDVGAGEVYKHSIRLKLQDQPFQVLVSLLERPGDVVTREELRQKLWPADTFVDFDTGLNSAIKKLRDVLGDSAEKPRYICSTRFWYPRTRARGADRASSPEFRERAGNGSRAPLA